MTLRSHPTCPSYWLSAKVLCLILPFLSGFPGFLVFLVFWFCLVFLVLPFLSGDFLFSPSKMPFRDDLFLGFLSKSKFCLDISNKKHVLWGHFSKLVNLLMWGLANLKSDSECWYPGNRDAETPLLRKTTWGPFLSGSLHFLGILRR